MSDNKAKLQLLAGLLIDDLTRMVKDKTLTAADRNVIRALLKDNNIELLPVPGSPMAGLVGAVSDNLPFPNEGLSH